jgi:hypothetical protein
MNTNRIIRLPPPVLLPRPFIPQLLPPPNLSQQSEQPSYDVKPRLNYIFGGVKEGLIRSLLIVIFLILVFFYNFL